MTTSTIDLPRPLVKFGWRTAPQWLWNQLQILLWAVLLAYIGMLAVAGLYYLVFQVNPTMNELWHTAVSNSDLRHNIRDIGEGLLGGLLAQQVIWNHYKKRSTELTWLDRLEIRLHIANVKDDKPLSLGQLLASPFLALLYAIPGFFLGLGLAWLIRYGVAPHLHGVGTTLQQTVQPHAPTLWNKLQGTVTTNWDKKLVGYGAAFFWGRRPVKGVFDDLQLVVAQWMVANGKAVHALLPPTFQARYNDVAARGVAAGRRHGVWWFILLGFIGLAGLALAGFGGYVLLYIAP
jgi:hypothetical protein